MKKIIDFREELDKAFMEHAMDVKNKERKDAVKVMERDGHPMGFRGNTSLKKVGFPEPAGAKGEED